MQEKLNAENLHLLGDTCNAIIQMVNSVADFTELCNVHKLHLLCHLVECDCSSIYSMIGAAPKLAATLLKVSKDARIVENALS